MTKNFILYRFFDGDKNLLYVGMSKSFITRLNAHCNLSEWFLLAKNITLEICDSSHDLKQKETLAIKKESPIFNKSESLSYERPIRKYRATDLHLFVSKNIDEILDIEKLSEQINYSINDILSIKNIKNKPDRHLLNLIDQILERILTKKFGINRTLLNELLIFLDLKEKLFFSKSSYNQKILVEKNLLDVVDGYFVLSKNYFKKSTKL